MGGMGRVDSRLAIRVCQWLQAAEELGAGDDSVLIVAAEPVLELSFLVAPA